MVARIQDRFGVALPMRTMFEAPTVEALGRAIEVAREDGPSQDGPALVPVEPAPHGASA